MGLYDTIQVNVLVDNIGVILTSFQTKDLEKLMIIYDKDSFFPLDVRVFKAYEMRGANAYLKFLVDNGRLVGIKEAVIEVPIIPGNEYYIAVDGGTGEVIWDVGKITPEEFAQMLFFALSSDFITKPKGDEILLKSDKTSVVLTPGKPQWESCKSGSYIDRKMMMFFDECFDSYYFPVGTNVFVGQKRPIIITIKNPRLMSLARYVFTERKNGCEKIADKKVPVTVQDFLPPIDFLVRGKIVEKQ